MDMERLAEIFEAVSVLPLRPSDVLVFRTERALDHDHAGMITEYLEERTGHANIVVLSEGARIEVIRPEEDTVVREIEHVALHRPVAGPSAQLPAGPPKSGKAPGAVA